MKKIFYAFAAVLLLGTGASSLYAQNTLFGVTAFDNQLFTVDPTTGQGTSVGNLGSQAFAYGIATFNNNLYVFDQTSDLILPIDPATGVAGTGINIGVGAIAGEGDLAFRADGTGFLSSVFDADLNPADNLYSFNIQNGTSTLLGSTGVPLDGLAFNGSTLYALGQDDGMLYTVNQTTAALTPIGLPGIAKNSPFGAIAFAPDGTLYGAIDDTLYTINTSTGAATVVGSGLGFNSVSGLAFANLPPVPEPTLIALFGLSGLLSLAIMRKKQNDRF